MKMGSGMFWGILLIVIGVSLILKIIFHIDFPIFKIVIAFVFIYLGIKILIGPNFKFFSERKTENTVVFGHTRFDSFEANKEYNIVFGKGEYDFSDLTLDSVLVTKLDLHTVFGNSRVILPPLMPVKIEIDAAFSGVTFPNGNTASFGTSVYTSKNFDDSKPYLYIKADVVFGSMEIVQKIF